MASSHIDLSAAAWCKSTYSNGDGGNCIEVAKDFPGAARWRKSSHSNGSGGNCISVADNLPGLVPVRDTKTVPHGPTVIIPAAVWTRFVAAVKGNAFQA
ncbi:DUF397 domain-containing protein [Streptomyces sp. NPDC048483]|uniref:DUF397 domain-containing protein n=1 Tax=Streptomyces sp. NPDC048483 TaxID=3154927 RepID=UPI00341A1D38